MPSGDEGKGREPAPPRGSETPGKGHGRVEMGESPAALDNREAMVTACVAPCQSVGVVSVKVCSFGVWTGQFVDLETCAKVPGALGTAQLRVGQPDSHNGM